MELSDGQCEMQVRAPAKLNLVLAVAASREDGFHPLVSVMEAIDLCDTLHVRVNRSGVSGVRVDAPGLPGGDTLVTRAVKSLLEHLRVHAAVDITINKQIPVGAGLGGGSSDAAAGIGAVNTLLGAPCGLSELHQLAASVGSDVPFFIDPQYGALVEGRGERVAPLAAGTLPARSWLIIWPGESNPTADVYRRYMPARSHLPEAGSAISDAASGRFHNDLAEPALAGSPAMLELARRMTSTFHHQPVLVAGSGSAVAVEVADEIGELVRGVADPQTIRAMGWEHLVDGMRSAIVAVARSWRSQPDW